MGDAITAVRRTFFDSKGRALYYLRLYYAPDVQHLLHFTRVSSG